MKKRSIVNLITKLNNSIWFQNEMYHYDIHKNEIIIESTCINKLGARELNKIVGKNTNWLHYSTGKLKIYRE